MSVVATGNSCCNIEISSSSLPGYTINGAVVVVSVPGGGSCCFGFLTVGGVGGGFFIGLGDLEGILGIVD